MTAYPYGHNPYGAMIECNECGRKFRTIERLNAHRDDPDQRADCKEAAWWRSYSAEAPR